MRSEHFGMEHDGPEYPASLYFCEELNAAVKSGSARDIATAVDLQEVNSTTEGISNALKVRTFLRSQEDVLLKLQTELIEAETSRDVLLAVGVATRKIESMFEGIFLATEAATEFAKLRGDARFREVLQGVSSEGRSIKIARQLARVDLMNLDEPSAVYIAMEGDTIFVVNDLRGKAEALYREGMSTDLIEIITESVAYHLARIDEELGRNRSLAL